LFLKDETEVLFACEVSEIMPISEEWGLDFFKDRGEFFFGREFFIVGAAFNSQADVEFFCVFQAGEEAVFDAGPELGELFAALNDGLEF
jgi:hypothetical protein